jgi:hypothetical protein
VNRRSIPPPPRTAPARVRSNTGSTTRNRAQPATPPAAPPPPPEAAKSASPLAPTGLVAAAKRLREEQLKAQVKYYAPEQETNPELDAVTAAIVAELHSLQQAGATALKKTDRPDYERELSRHLALFLDKLLSRRRKTFLDHKVQEIQRRIATLFFNSELFAQLSSSKREEVRVAWADQAVFYALKRHEAAIVDDLRRMEYVDARVRDAAIERLREFEKDLRREFLARTTPELEKMLSLFKSQLTVFFRTWRKELATFCGEVITESGVGRNAEMGYKLGPTAFDAFRETFELKLLYVLVRVLQEPLANFGREMKTELRGQTIEFMGDPQILSAICEVLSDACYEYLYGEGFLDLPGDWRDRLERAEAR